MPNATESNLARNVSASTLHPWIVNSTGTMINATKSRNETNEFRLPDNKFNGTTTISPITNVTLQTSTAIRRDNYSEALKATAIATTSADVSTVPLIKTTNEPNKTTQQAQPPRIKNSNGDHDDKKIHEIIQDLRDENLKLEDDVKEQGSSLRHFIIICSISVVVATSMVVALIVLLFK
jgi:hypothetical protein